MTEHIGTTCVQGGYRPGDAEPRQVPIYQSTTWKYDTSEHMGRLFDLEESGYFYTRLQNPTNDAVAAKIAEHEGAAAGMLTSSGQAANFFALFNIMGAGDHVVASSAIYGGTYNLIAHTMRRMGVESTFVAPDCTDEELEAAFRPNTKAVFGETIANPALDVLDIERFAAAAQAHGVPLIVDNTFPTPVMCRPIEWGADIVTHSTTKYMDGHGAAVGGAIVDSGAFDWDANAERFPGLTTPDETYHGVVYTERFGRAGAYITKATAQLMRDLGCIQSPQPAAGARPHIEQPSALFKGFHRPVGCLRDLGQLFGDRQRHPGILLVDGTDDLQLGHGIQIHGAGVAPLGGHSVQIQFHFLPGLSAVKYTLMERSCDCIIGL